MKSLTSFIKKSNNLNFSKKLTLKLDNNTILEAVIKVKDLNESFAKEQIINSVLNKTIKEIISITESIDKIDDVLDNKLDFDDSDNKFETVEFFIPWTSIFDNASYYPSDIIFKILKTDDNVISSHLENQYGWSNQPEVVVFKISSNNIKETKDRLTAKLQNALQTQWVRIDIKDWN
jgi:hypothetical protein